MAGFWGRRKRQEQAAHDADLARRAEKALVAADERIRTARDEHAFAQAELGEAMTADLGAALQSVQEHMQEAFQLHQLNHDEIPDTDEELRTRNARIVQLCEWAESLLDEKMLVLADSIAQVRQAPEILAGLRRDAAHLQTRVAAARATIERLAQRYSDSAMAQVIANADEADQLLAFAAHSADVSERRREARRTDESIVALETATEAVRRAESVLDAVDDFEIEALRAESTLAQYVQQARAEMIAAGDVPRTEAVSTALARLNDELGALAVSGTKVDPFAELARLRAAGEELDTAVTTARHRQAHPLPSPAHVQSALDEADRQLAVARNLISGHRGWIGADARTRLAEAERLRSEVTPLIPAEATREQALAGARRVALLAYEALQLAQRDIDSSRPDTWGGDGWGGQNAPPRTTGSDIASGVLGGFVIGSILDGLFD